MKSLRTLKVKAFTLIEMLVVLLIISVLLLLFVLFLKHTFAYELIVYIYFLTLSFCSLLKNSYFPRYNVLISLSFPQHIFPSGHGPATQLGPAFLNNIGATFLTSSTIFSAIVLISH